VTDLRAVCATLAAFVAHGCTTNTPNPDPHYVLGSGYQVGSVWFYPRASEDLDETGLAAVAKNGHASLTSDGELFDQTVLAAAHPTLQLPAIAHLTNLENGLQVTVRVNDRGSGDPHRLVEITRRTAVLLGVNDNAVARVRLQVLPNESRAAEDALPGAPRLVIAAAPRGTVEVAELPPLAGVAQRQESRATARATSPSAAAERVEATGVAPPLRLPEVVVRTVPQPGQLMVRLDTFSEHRYAAAQQTKMSALGAGIVPFREGRATRFRVEIGPLSDVSRADAVLDQALASGIPDARIVIE
jgi:peptidoglycan lytic transglycosylase